MQDRIFVSRRLGLFLAMAVALDSAGCGAAPRPTATPADPPPVLPGPPPLPSAPSIPLTPAAPEAVYRNPKIGLVYLRAHQDAAGRLLGPQLMYQVIDPGGWNVEAVEQGRGYIPAVNVELPPGQGSPYAAAARVLPPVADSSPLLDPAAAAGIVITGLMRRDDQAEAEGLARRQGTGSRAQYDEQAGWLLLPPDRPP
jgi:hypothetical protein